MDLREVTINYNQIRWGQGKNVFLFSQYIILKSLDINEYFLVKLFCFDGNSNIFFAVLLFRQNNFTKKKYLLIFCNKIILPSQE